MSFNVLYTENFRKEAKQLAKKYTSFSDDLEMLITDLERNPIQGKPLGKDCYKIRMIISSKGKGKSGGARVITCLLLAKTEVYLLSIYDKSQNDSISNKELTALRRQINLA
jgi:mRNA-degrading endonuclease RelE of RelBE toxin-antitoxin system